MQVYLSPLLNKDFKELDGRRKRQLLKDSTPSGGGMANGGPRTIQVLPSHRLTSARIAEHLGSSQDLAKMLADYRAQGGRLRQEEADPFAQPLPQPPVREALPSKHPVKADSEEEKPAGQNDMTWASKVSHGQLVSTSTHHNNRRWMGQIGRGGRQISNSLTDVSVALDIVLMYIEGFSITDNLC